MGEGRVLQKKTWSGKIRLFAHLQLVHGKDYQVLPSVTGLERPVTSLRETLEEASILSIKYQVNLTPFFFVLICTNYEDV